MIKDDLTSDANKRTSGIQHTHHNNPEPMIPKPLTTILLLKSTLCLRAPNYFKPNKQHGQLNGLPEEKKISITLVY